MDEYSVFIDETGSFSYLDKGSSSFIAGWVCKKNDSELLDELLGSVVDEFNRTLKTGKLIYPDHLHFIPLHIKDKRINKDDGIHVDTGTVPRLVEKIFSEVRNKTVLVFHSSGRPAVIFHEQATYMDILRNTLIQLVDEPLFTPHCQISIEIGHRRSKMLYGEAGYRDTHAYEKYIAGRIQDELLQAFEGKKPKIKVTIADARKEPGNTG